jgi:hypothetical protein
MSGEPADPFRQRWRRVGELVQTLEQAADPATREAARELLGTVLDLHRAGLARLLDVAAAALAADALAAACAGDELLASLLLLHGLHPDGPEARVRRALERAGPVLRAHGVAVDEATVADGVVRVRLRDTTAGRTSWPHGLREAVEEAVWEAAPDVAAVAVEGPGSGRIALPLVADDGRAGR